MRKILPLFIILAMLSCMAVPAGISAITYGVSILVNGKYVDFSGGYGEPFISDEGRTMVPVRGTAEAYGCTVEWDGPNYQAVVTYGSHYVIIPINKTYVITDSGTVAMDTYARIIEDRTYLPIRYVMEAVGAKVDWNASSRTVIISAPDVVDDNPGSSDTSSAPSGDPSTPSVEPPPSAVDPMNEPDPDPSLALLKESLKARGKYDSATGYVYRETTSVNSSLTSQLVYDPVMDLVYVLIEMDLGGSTGQNRSSMRLNVNGSGHTSAYYAFSVQNAGALLTWNGHFDKTHYADAASYTVDSTNSTSKDVSGSMLLSHMAVYESGIAIQAVDSYCRSFVTGLTTAVLGFAQ